MHHHTISCINATQSYNLTDSALYGPTINLKFRFEILTLGLIFQDPP